MQGIFVRRYTAGMVEKPVPARAPKLVEMVGIVFEALHGFQDCLQEWIDCVNTSNWIQFDGSGNICSWFASTIVC